MPSKQRFNIALLGGEYATAMTCKEAGCARFVEGWLTVLDPGDADHAVLIQWIRERSGRRFWDFASQDALEGMLRLAARGSIAKVPHDLHALLERTPPGLMVFLFEPGQQCFQEHLDREVVFGHHDKMGNRRVHTRPLDFNEHFNQESGAIERAIERG